MKCCIFGRGLIAERLVKLCNEIMGNKIIFTNIAEEAEVIFLAQSEENVRSWIENNMKYTLNKLCYDFSGFTKREGISNYAGLNVLYPNHSVISSQGLISLPGCYASSVILPILFLQQNYDVSISKIYAVSLGGRSTLGSSKSLSSRSARLSSKESQKRHLDEIIQWTGIPENSIHFNLFVADIDDGILTRITAENSFIRNETQSFIGLDISGWRNLHINSINIGERETTDSCIFRVSSTDRGVEIVSFIHNLEFPIVIALRHLSLVAGFGERKQII